MKIIADLHLHSHFSRATSPKMNLEGISEGARKKGLNLLGTGDFTHPKYFEELKRKLLPSDNGTGIYEYNGIHFMLQVEISLIYQQGGKQRRVHHVIFAPDFEAAEQINSMFSKWGRLDYDGRPIFGKSSMEFMDALMALCPDAFVVPAHAWTPWYGIFGSMSGFDSLKEAFGEHVRHIHAIETGLSSDPAMNWRISELDNVSLISNSDSHSPYPWRLGREANVFDTKMTYKDITNTITTRKGFEYTIEVDPAYGKYHYDGHRNCGVSMSPEEARKHNNICPVCGKPLTLGVEHRVEDLADRPAGYRPKHAVDFIKLLPLAELIATARKRSLSSPTVTKEMHQIMKDYSELYVLTEMPEDEIRKIADESLAELILKNRNQELKIKPGYDGVYGEIILESGAQSSLLDFS
ncbi:DNA helicase UvrD [Candidatus Micrarchaeota archaeon]|nr:MAG: DNA helicase UvrD [Candidatus Micrarchaeota archaeon]